MGYPMERPPERTTAARRRVRFSDGNLGVFPVVAAAIPSVKDLASKAITSVIAIVDPGKKRDANRKARAQMWGDFARAGSITAARRVYGGQTSQYTKEEKALYVAQWNSLRSAEPKLAAQAQALKGLSIPEPGSDVTPPYLAPEEVAAIQQEVDEYRAPEGVVTSTPKAAATPQQAGAGWLLGLGLAGAWLASKLRRR